MSEFTLQFFGSLVAILALVLITFLLGFRQSARLSSQEEAYQLFRLAPGGFEPEQIGVDENGAAAVARDADGRLAVLVPHGNQFVFRLLAPGSKVVLRDRVLEFAGLPGLTIALGEQASDWVSADIGDNRD